MQMTLGRWGIALGVSLAAHLTGVVVWSGSSPEAQDERAAGALAQVAVVLSPSQFYPSVAAEETAAEDVEEAAASEATPVSQPLRTVSATRVSETAQQSPLKPIADVPRRSTQAIAQVATSPSVSAPNVTEEAVSVSAEAAQAKPLKQPAERKVAAIAKTTPVEQVVEPEILQPKKSVERPKRANKSSVKKKPRKAKRKKGKTAKKASRSKAASSARKGTARRNVGDGGRSNKAVGRAKLSSYLGRVASKVRRQKRYPKAALRKKQGGTAVVAFTITKRGSVIGVRLKRRSGNAALDREVLNMVRRAAPFPPIPKGMGRSRIALSIPVRFAVR